MVPMAFFDFGPDRKKKAALNTASAFDYRPILPEDHPIKHTNTFSGQEQTWERLRAETQKISNGYPLRVPSAIAKRINWADPQDPLRRQILPSIEELHLVDGFVTDPLAEEQVRYASRTYIPGLLQKYHGRVLLQVSGHCAIHCRFCFRRHETYRDIPKNLQEWSPALAFIANAPSIHEVLLSGGDPLMVADWRLAELVQQLANIPHLARLRIHSRMPVVTPKRIGNKLINWLTATRLTPIMVIHCNHPAELGASAKTALARLVNAGISVFNQSVLLKGVNDDVDTLATLCETLIDLRVIPYYLHLLDPVAGAAHFHVTEGHACALITELQRCLPGYAIPRLVREQPGEPSKTLVMREPW